MFYRNKYDQTGESSQMGESSELQFKKIAEKLGNQVTDATFREQISHIDFHIIDKKGEKYTVDVKSRKKVKRKDNNVDDEVIWIEFKNVQGKKGWLYGMANFIAFEREDSFLMVSRPALAELCEKIVDLEKINDNIKYPLYTGYQRYGRKDLLSLIKIEDITNNLSHTFFKKNEN
jgi:hypothetical protein